MPYGQRFQVGRPDKPFSGLFRRLGRSRLCGRRLGSGGLHRRRFRRRSRVLGGSRLLLGRRRFGAGLRRGGRRLLLRSRRGPGCTTAATAPRARGRVRWPRRLGRACGCRARWRWPGRAGFCRLGRMDAGAQALFFSLPGAPDLFGSNAQENSSRQAGRLPASTKFSRFRSPLTIPPGRLFVKYQKHRSF